jgi:hypothetical protein
MIFRSENYIEGGVRGFFRKIFCRRFEPNCCENYIEGGGGGYVVFFEFFFVADSNQIAVSYCTGSVEFRYSKSSGH